MLVYSAPDGLGSNFFEGLKPSDIGGGDKKSLEKLENYYAALLKYNVWIDVFVHRLPTQKGSAPLFQARDSVCSMKNLFDQF